MTDLVKRLRLCQHELTFKAADEIERLERKLHFYKNMHEKFAQQAVRDDMREWLFSAKDEFNFKECMDFLDAYCKERGIE